MSARSRGAGSVARPASAASSRSCPDMQALVLTAPHAFVVKEVPCPSPGANEVLCRVRAIAICGTDAEIIEGTFKGRWPKAYPFIPGHEWAGEVIEAAGVARGAGLAPRTPVRRTAAPRRRRSPRCRPRAHNP